MAPQGSTIVHSTYLYHSLRKLLNRVLQKYKSAKKKQIGERAGQCHHERATILVVLPQCCDRGGAQIAVYASENANALTLPTRSGLQLHMDQYHHSILQTARKATGIRRCPSAICCLNGSDRGISLDSEDRPVTAPDVKFVTLPLWLSSEDYFEGYMDTGARVTVMRESTALELGLDSRHDPPQQLEPINGQAFDAIGFAPNVKLRTACKDEFQLEDIYVVSDNQMSEQKDAYLSLDLIRRLGHLVRVVCKECDR